jgi:head-tail adaptor
VLSPAELAGMRSTLTASMPGTVVVMRSTQTSDGMGGVSDAWAAVGTVTARVSPTGAGLDDIVGGEFTNITPWVVTVPHGSSVTDRDRIAYLGQTFEVMRTSTPRSYESCVRLECKEVG